MNYQTDFEKANRAAPARERAPLGEFALLVVRQIGVAFDWLAAIILICAVGGCKPRGSGDSSAATPPEHALAGRPLHETVIRPVHSRMTVSVAATSASSKSATIACNTCHATRPPNLQNRAAADLDQFHQGLVMNHGRQACAACHHAADGYSSLHLADGTAVAVEDSMRLCAQCHGPQFRDYQHGSHGGMNGYWDLTRGPRERNHCLHCHDPHAPAIAVVQPVAGPRDRFPPSQPQADHE